MPVCRPSSWNFSDDNRASFATLDGELLTFHRLRYDWQKTQGKILKAGLSRFLAERLSEGV